jgi:hypothetical protein
LGLIQADLAKGGGSGKVHVQVQVHVQVGEGGALFPFIFLYFWVVARWALSMTEIFKGRIKSEFGQDASVDGIFWGW